MAEIILLQGAPGSGKTTHGQRLKDEFPNQLEHMSIGNKLRSISTGETTSKFRDEILKQSNTLSRSEPLCHETVNAVVFELINSCPSINYVLVDGYPSFVEQIPLFYDSIQNNGHTLLAIVQFEISELTCQSRLSQRGTRHGENESDEEFALKRFNIYRTFTLPVIRLLSSNSLSINIDAEPSTEKVWKAFRNIALNIVFPKRN